MCPAHLVHFLLLFCPKRKTSAPPSARVLKQVRGNNIFIQDACREDYKMITDEAVIPAIQEA